MRLPGWVYARLRRLLERRRCPNTTMEIQHEDGQVVFRIIDKCHEMPMGEVRYGADTAASVAARVIDMADQARAWRRD